MADIRYKAFISYSHSDEKWAAWLHRALETYRVPKYLVGQHGRHGPVPQRLVPVFRDRDELSTGRSLNDKIVSALSRSDALVVICSRDAARSQWVNEEIRQFRSMGREERVFCVLVDGDPGSVSSTKACFPPALFEGLEQTGLEPLAADPRKWADGKSLARLKLLAGLLGVRLDELRQRDLKRRRRWQASAGLGVIAVFALAAIAVSSGISQNIQREKAEHLATFVVDLGERLQSDVDLETLAIISSEASKHLSGLDLARLSPTTSVKVGLAIRQLGYVSEGQGRPQEARAAFERSLDLFQVLHEKYPNDQEILFELGQSEYYVGNLFYQQGDYLAAREPLEKYLEVSQKLVATDPDNPNWVLELSYSITGLVALRLKSGHGVDETLLEDIDRAVLLIESAMENTPEDHVVTDYYATTLAWAADAQLEACGLDNAELSRKRSLDLTAAASRADPSNNELKLGHVYALTGLSNIQNLRGELKDSEDSLVQAITLMEELSAADPSNMLHLRYLLWPKFLLAVLYAETGRKEQAHTLFTAIEPGMQQAATEPEPVETAVYDYVDFLLAWSNIEFGTGERAMAEEHLDRAVRLLTMDTTAIGQNVLRARRMAQARFQWWELGRTGSFASYPEVSLPDANFGSAYVSCTIAEIQARLAVMSGDLDAAQAWHSYLDERAYARPAYLRFCQRYQLCPIL